jgi:hypothetical protein
MPTSEWREEKSEYVIQSICRVLSSPDTSQAVRDELSGEALSNALKLFSDALEGQLDTQVTKWSPALVELFIKKPDQCDQWLQLMAEPDFSAEGYWKKNKDDSQ